jgi:hypothetical protein
MPSVTGALSGIRRPASIEPLGISTSVRSPSHHTEATQVSSLTGVVVGFLSR